jgi:hypothetical protein
VAVIPVTAVGYAVVSPKSLRPRKYRSLCVAAGVSLSDAGWGILRCLDAEGSRVTLITDDVDYMKLLLAGRKSASLDELQVPVSKFPVTRSGWPDEWSQALDSCAD